MSTTNSCKGFSVLGVVLALTVLAAMATTVATLVASNQSTRSQQSNMDQAYFSAQAALEYAKKQVSASPTSCSFNSSDFAGSSLSISRTSPYSSKINVTATTGSASNSFSIADTTPLYQSNCLVIDATAANMSSNNKKLQDILLSKSSTCCFSSIGIVSMVVSWTPSPNESVKEIQMDTLTPKEYHDSQASEGSGTTFPFESAFTMSTTSTYTLNYIRWQQAVANKVFTLVFNMSDGSSKSVVVDPP